MSSEPESSSGAPPRSQSVTTFAKVNAVNAANAALVERLLSTAPGPLAEGGYSLRVLQTVGRRTGLAHRNPVGVLRRLGSAYLVCPDRSRDWVQNLLAQPGCLVRAGDELEQLRAIPVVGGEAGGTVGAYLSVVEVPWARQAFGLGEDPDRQQIAAALPRMAVFRLEQDEGEGVLRG